MTHSWKQVVMIAVSALVVVIAADYYFGKISPPRQLREVDDGMRDFRDRNPDTLVIGSSHGRTLHVLGGELERRTGGQQTLVSVPLENGKIVPYEWLLEKKLRPLMDASDGNGGKIKSRLRRFMLITEWWDTCPHGDGSPYWNLPARAWTVSDFVADVGGNGITGFNRNYLQNRLRENFNHSSLVFDRTQQSLVWMIVDIVRHKPLTLSPEALQAKIALWQGNVEGGARCIGDAEQMAALARIAEFARQRDLEMTILLFPRKPETLTAKARSTTLPAFADLMRSFAAPRGIRLVDLTTTSPMTDADFMDDFDHINATGNRKFAEWALDHDLSFLMESPPPAALAPAQRTG